MRDPYARNLSGGGVRHDPQERDGVLQGGHALRWPCDVWGVSDGIRDSLGGELPAGAWCVPGACGQLSYVNPQERKPQAQRDWLEIL